MTIPERRSARPGPERRRAGPGRVAVIVLAALAVATGAVVADARDRAATPGAPAPRPEAGWDRFSDPARNLRFGHPAGWVVRPHPQVPELLLVVPPEFASRPPAERLPFVVAVQLDRGYYVGGVQAELSAGRLPGGRPFVRSVDDATVISPPEVQPPVRRWYEIYDVDWGRFCASFPTPPRRDCGAHSVKATLAAGTAALMERYRPAATAIVRTLAPLRATRPSVGDRARPACRAGQWRVVPEYGWSYLPASHAWLVQGTALARGGGRACHLRVTLRMSAERADGTPLAVPGTPSRRTIEGDLPDDTSGVSPSDDLAPPTPLTWHWAWRNWCRRPLGGARVRITAPDGRSVTKPLPPLGDYLRQGHDPCGGVRPDAGWGVSPWP